jgi:HTH-type transcriptional regulator / antitoxin HipB
MIQNERQYLITQTKLREFEQELAAIDPQDPNLHPRQIIGWTNSLNFTIDKLKQEIAEYEQLKTTNLDISRLG